MLRGGAFKPRTSPYANQGMGKAGLELLCAAREETGMPIVTEIMDVRDVQLFVDMDIDVLQIGARNTQNFNLLKEVGMAGKPVPAQARHRRHHRRAAHERRVHHEQGKPQRHAVRARHPHLREAHAQHVRPQRRARTALPHAPARGGRPEPRYRLHALRGPHGARRHRRRCRRARRSRCTTTRAAPGPTGSRRCSPSSSPTLMRRDRRSSARPSPPTSRRPSGDRPRARRRGRPRSAPWASWGSASSAARSPRPTAAAGWRVPRLRPRRGHHGRGRDVETDRRARSTPRGRPDRATSS